MKPKTSNNTSHKTPKFYNEEKNLFIKECSIDESVEVRMFVSTNTHTPVNILTSMLEIEKNKQVLRSVLMNKKIPRKSVSKFVMNKDDERVDWFENDEELIERFTQ
jgi:hypothetical protein